MPYKKNYRKKRYRKRSPYAGYLDTASKALAVAYSVKRLLNVETKFIQTQVTAGAASQAGLFTLLNSIGQGDSAELRDGNQLKLTYLQVSWDITQHVTAVATSVRVIIVKDKRPDGAVFTLAQLLADATANDNIVSPKNFDFARRFVICFDRRYSMSDSGTKKFIGSYYKKLNEIQRFTGSSAGIGTIESPTYHMVTLTSEASNVPSITLFSRMGFIDN